MARESRRRWPVRGSASECHGRCRFGWPPPFPGARRLRRLSAWRCGGGALVGDGGAVEQRVRDAGGVEAAVGCDHGGIDHVPEDAISGRWVRGKGGRECEVVGGFRSGPE
eukprot:11488233-Heterocapsa_arctica.AAC.1